MRLSPHAARIAIGAALASAASAQSIAPFQGTKHATDWPASADAPGRFGRAATGRVAGGPSIDLVQMDGSQATLLVDPDLGFAPVPLPVAANDAAVLSGGGVAGLDAIAVVTSVGLELWWWDAGLGAFGSQTLDAGAWAGATTVRAADLDGDGDADLCGVAADGVTVLSQITGPGGGFAAGPSFVSLAAVTALVPVRWDPDAESELAVATDLGVDVRERDGTLVQSFAAVLPGGALCAIGQSSSSCERLAWITNYAAAGVQWLVVLSPLGLSDQVDLGALDAFAIVATDYDLDGDDDVLISHRYSYDLLRIENQRSPANPSGPTFVEDPTAMQTFFADAPGAAPNNEAWPAVADLDGDGDDDVAFAAQKAGRQVIFRGEAVAEDGYRVGVAPVDYTVDAPGVHGNLNVTLSAPSVLDAAATHLEVDVWLQASPGADIEAAGVGHQELALPQTFPAALSIQIPEGDCAFSNAYHYQIRVVEQDASGRAVAVYPAYTGTFTLMAADVTAYAGDETVGAPSDVPAPTPIDSSYDPGTMQRKRIKTYPTGSVPTAAN